MKYLDLWSPGLWNIFWKFVKPSGPPSYILNVRSLKPLAKSSLIPLGLTAAASAADAGIHKKILCTRSYYPRAIDLGTTRGKIQNDNVINNNVSNVNVINANNNVNFK